MGHHTSWGAKSRFLKTSVLSVGSVTQNAVRCQGSSNAWPRSPFPKLLYTGPWPCLGSKSILGVWTCSPEPRANVRTCRALCRGRGACSPAVLILWCYGAFLKTCWVYGPGLGVGEWRSRGWVASAATHLHSREGSWPLSPQQTPTGQSQLRDKHH